MTHHADHRYQLISLCVSVYAVAVTAFYVHRVIAGGAGATDVKPKRDKPAVSEQPHQVTGNLNVIAERNLFGPLQQRPDSPPEVSAPRPPQAGVTTQPARVVASEQPRRVPASGADRITVTGVIEFNGISHVLMKNDRAGENRYVRLGRTAWGYRFQGFDGEAVTLEKDGRLFRVPLGTGPMEQPSGRVREYDFGSLKDGANIKTLGGTLADGVYTFEAGQGLQLEQAGVTDNYNIELTFKFDQTNGFRKIVDFKNLTVDDGLYVYNGQLRFYGSEGAGGTIEPGQEYNVRLERDQDTQTVHAYLNGEMVLEFNDGNNKAVFDDGNAHFFMDDRSGSEQSAGSARRIRIWDSRGASGR